MKKINYKLLLEKYMLLVYYAENITWLDDTPFPIDNAGITDEDYVLLKEIEKKLKRNKII